MKRNLYLAAVGILIGIVSVLGIGPKNQDGFTPFDHGIPGIICKILAGVGLIYCFYALSTKITKHKPLNILITLLITAAAVVLGVVIIFAVGFHHGF